MLTTLGDTEQSCDTSHGPTATWAFLLRLYVDYSPPCNLWWLAEMRKVVLFSRLAGDDPNPCFVLEGM